MLREPDFMTSKTIKSILFYIFYFPQQESSEHCHAVQAQDLVGVIISVGLCSSC